MKIIIGVSVLAILILVYSLKRYFTSG